MHLFRGSDGHTFHSVGYVVTAAGNSRLTVFSFACWLVLVACGRGLAPAAATNNSQRFIQKTMDE